MGLARALTAALLIAVAISIGTVPFGCNAILGNDAWTPASTNDGSSPGGDAAGDSPHSGQDSPTGQDTGGSKDSSVPDGCGDAPPPDTTHLNDAVLLVAGSEVTCAVRASGGVVCWGDNSTGVLGADPTAMPNSSKPLPIGFPSGVAVTSMALGKAYGDGHGCITDSTNYAWCWGSGFGGQLGNNATNNGAFPMPSKVIDTMNNPLMEFAKSTAAGAFYSCAVGTDSASSVFCWGMGMGAGGNGPLPTSVSTLVTGASAVSAGYLFSCALTNSGGMPQVICFGDNGFGQLGNNNSTTPFTPAQLSVKPTALATGDQHACIVDDMHNAYCWGDDTLGQIGVNGGGMSPVPVAVVGLTGNVQSIAAGGRDTCAVTTSNGLLCLGDNSNGQLGIGTSDMSGHLNPTPVGTVKATSVTVGLSHVCAIFQSTDACQAGGPVYCWGANDKGQCGDGTTTSPRTLPVQVVAP